MGTRADFYIGEGATAEWLGSVAWDGYEWDEDKESPLASAKTEDDFRAAVNKLSSRDDFTSPDRGWPWPWDDSCTTDYAYCLTTDGVKSFCFGRPCSEKDEEENDNAPKATFPNMKAVQNVDFGKRSGIMIFSVPK